MTPVLAVFLDGLGFEGLERMPFLSSQLTVRRLTTELGYSITCHASMYTGVRPDRHHLWFLWQRNPEGSPFRWLRPLRLLDPLDNLPLRLLAVKATRRFVRTSSIFGIPYVVHMPWRDLPELDVSERRLWDEPGYLPNSATIFDVFRGSGLPFAIHGMHRSGPQGLAALEGEPATAALPFRYLFAGDIDHVSHAAGQDSPAATAVLRRVDAAIERWFTAARRADPSTELLVWSDHGHHRIQRLDPFPLLERHRIRLDRHLHVIDTNYLRLWVDSATERAALGERLDGIGVGRVLDAATLARYRCTMPDDRYGNLVFYLDRPYAFSRTIWGFARGLVSAHGYLPDYPESDGVLVSSRAVQSDPLGLVDVAPSILDLVGLTPGPGLDGGVIWR